MRKQERFLSLLLAALALAFAREARADAAACAALAGRAISAAEIGLPTGGARIATATFVAATAALPEHCAVLGAIAPVDPSAPAINVQVNLPSAWNGKAVQYGGAGFNGVPVTGLVALRDAPPDVPLPLAQGYATFGTDSGHQVAALPEIQAFALNEEALVNFAYAAYKKTRDVAVQVMRAYYGRAPARLYYFGGSEGGREGLAMAQRFPADYDGIVSVVPVINWVALQTAGNNSGVVQQDSGWLEPPKVALLRRAVMAACDALDGLADGIIGNDRACAETFRAEALRCPDGRHVHDECLSDAQLAAVRALRLPFRFNVPLANGITAYPGFGFGGEDQPEGLITWVTGAMPAQFPLPAPDQQGRQWYFGSGAMRYFIVRDARFNSLRYSADDFAARVRAVSQLMDMTDPDLSAFLARGGRLILKENMADYAQSPYVGIGYYNAVIARMGQGEVDRFIRFYTTPGANHGGRIVNGRDGAAMPDRVDLLAALDAWVERGTAPDTLTLSAHAAEPPFATTATRPLCRYPTFPRYGGGDAQMAASFTCAER
jgi:feruloyl esterase